MLDDAPVDAEDCEVDDGWAVVVSEALVPEVLVCGAVLLELDGSALELAVVLELVVVMLPLEETPPTPPAVVAEAVLISDDEGALVADALLISADDEAALVACGSLFAVDEIPPPIPPITVESEGAEVIVEEAAVVDVGDSVVWLAVPPVGELATGVNQSVSCGPGRKITPRGRTSDGEEGLQAHYFAQRKAPTDVGRARLQCKKNELTSLPAGRKRKTPTQLSRMQFPKASNQSLVAHNPARLLGSTPGASEDASATLIWKHPRTHGGAVAGRSGT